MPAKRFQIGAPKAVRRSTTREQLPSDSACVAELMQLTPAERDRILAAAALVAKDEYRTTPALTDFEAFGEEDLLDATPEG